MVGPGQVGAVGDLWTNAGRGIAEFTSYNFVSDDTNYRGQPPFLASDPEFASPVPDNSHFEKIALGTLVGHRPELPVSAELWFIGNQVTDRLNPDRSGFNQRGSSFSIFDNDLDGIGLRGQTTINRFNAAAINEWLLPRAVAYSAALYDYFFRGRVQIDSSVAEGNTITITVRNTSAQPYTLKPQLPGQGDGAEWSLYYDTSDGTRSRLPLSGDDIGEATIAAGDTYELSFPMPQNVDAAKEKPFMLVFNGVIGQEAGVAGKAFSPAGARGFLVWPMVTANDGWAGRWQLTRMAGTWLSRHSKSLAGNVDWKGHFPSDTLTWDGPPSRYFYDANRRGYSRSIYKGGSLLTRAPANVQGVAINRAGEPRLLVVTHESGQLRLYSRPLRDRYANDSLFDAGTNPEGWRQIHAGPELPPFTPTFFNASGTEAQLVTVSGTAISQRVKLAIAGNVVTRTSVSSVGRGVTRYERHDQFPAGEHVLNKGQRLSDAGAASCIWADDCTSRIDCGGRDLYCNRRELDASDTASRIYETDYRAVLDNKTAICVDYDGDQEVLCEIAYLDDSLGRMHQTLSERATQLTRIATQCNGSVLERHSENSQHTEVLEELWLPGAGTRTLRLGSLEIPLKGDERDEGLQMAVDYFRVGDVNLAPTGNITQYQSFRHTRGRILYVDARNETVVYESDELQTRQEASSSTPLADGKWQLGQSTSSSSDIRETVAYVHGQRHSLARREMLSNGSETPGELRTHGPIGVTQCYNQPSEDVEVQDSVLTDAADWSTLIHPRANDATQGYAIDREGNYVVSQPLWEASGAGFIRVGTWNSISNGEIDALLPGAGDSMFVEVKLLE